MDIPLFPLEHIERFFIIISRVAGFIAAIPVFSSSQTPVRVKTALVFVCALMLFPVMEKKITEVELSTGAFFLVITGETLLGLLLGLIARFIFTAAEFGATIIGYQMGFATAEVFDPQNQRQVSLISEFQSVFGILIFLAINGHHSFIKTAVASYDLLPPGKFDISGEAIPFVMQMASHMFTLGVQFSAPALAVLLLSGLILGVMSRVFPQLNVFMLSFPLNIGAGFIVIALTLSLMSNLIGREFDTLADQIPTLLSYLGQ